MEEEKQQSRRFSLEDDFMNYATDDLLFGLMYYFATYNPIEKYLYLTEKNFAAHKKQIYDICGVNSRTLKAHLNKLIERGLVVKKQEEIYTFPYDIDGNYQIIDNRMLSYIINTRSKQAVRIYCYLLNRFLWKNKNNEIYIFTVKELLRVLGYSTASSNQGALTLINDVLKSFAREGIIIYEDFYENVIDEKGKSVPVPRKKLLFVARIETEILKK